MASAVLKTIGGRTFGFSKLAATDGIKLQVALAKLVGSELAEVAKLATRSVVAQKAGRAANFDADLEELGGIVERVAAKASSEEIIALMGLVFRRAICDGRPIADIDVTFGDDSVTPWRAFIEGLKVNLGDFLAGSLSTGDQPETETKST